MNGNHKCQRCGLHSANWRAVSDIMDIGVCATCADFALNNHLAELGHPFPQLPAPPKVIGLITIQVIH